MNKKGTEFGNRGFSLLEVLVALVVFSIGVSGLLVALGYHLKDITFTEDHAHAVRIASREMNALRRMKYFPEQEVTGEEGRFTWTATAEEADYDELPGVTSDDVSSSQSLKPCMMDVTVEWSEEAGGERNRKVRLQGLELFQRS
jgi:prepilin-type N-terminal cleavage/methylation domain-containing protein